LSQDQEQKKQFQEQDFAAAHVMFERAIALHQQGRLFEAERIYREILRRQPDHIDALHLLGVIAFQTLHAERAVELIGRAIKLKPNLAEAHNNLGNVLLALKRPADALASYDQAIALNPNFAEAHNNRGIALTELKRFAEVVASCDKAIALKPDFAEPYNNRGNALNELKRTSEALASCDEAIARKADLAEAHNNRGNALFDLSRVEEALASFDRAIALKLDFAVAHNNRGNALYRLNRAEEALASCNRAIALKPDLAEAYNNRGNALFGLDRIAEALASYAKAIALKADFALAYSNQGNALNALERYEEALASCDKAVALKPDEADAYHNRGNAYFGLGRVELAPESYEKGLAIAPSPSRHSNLIYTLNFASSATVARQQAERARWNRLHGPKPAPPVPPHDNDPDPARRLRVGYVSSHFRSQASTYAFGNVLLCHDPAVFEVVCYSDTSVEDDLTARLRECSDKWRRTVGFTDDELAELVRADRIDILVDCVGHMAGHRLGVFSRKPAPIQVTAWGEPTGTGLNAIDYLLADPILVPAIDRALFAEQVFDLPCFLGYWAPDPLPEPTALPAIANGYVTFGSFNRPAKFQNPALRIWAAILRRLPNARLVLKGGRIANSALGARILQVFGEEGISPERITLLGYNDRADHFAAYQRIDIALDPFPHGGGITTLDALWMGVPVVTWAGRTVSSRLAAASLTALGLTDFVAADPESYVALAIAKAGDFDSLARLRAGLRARVAGSVIGDPVRYARAVEAAYRDMWLRWCAHRNAAPDS
jgi:protein O-GlcNAc transferase